MVLNFLIPSDGLEPLLELRAPVWGDLEGHPRRHHNSYKLFVVSRGEVVQLLVQTLDVPIELNN